MTSVEPTMRIPAWRSASPKNLKTRSETTRPTTAPANFTMCPNECSHSRGTASHDTRRMLRGATPAAYRGSCGSDPQMSRIGGQPVPKAQRHLELGASRDDRPPDVVLDRAQP